MKKTVTLIFCLILIFLVSGCSEQERNLEKLDKISNIKVIKNVVTFDKVNNATEYVVNYSGKNVTITTNEYTVLEEGSHKLRIKATATGYLDSSYSDAVDVNVIYLDVPNNLVVRNRIIYFDEVVNADGYIIKINNVEYDTRKEIIPVLENGIYEISIKAVSSKFIESIYSKSINTTIDDNTLIESINLYTYSIYSTFDLPLYSYDKGCLVEFVIEEINGKSINVLESLYIVENTLYIRSQSIKDQKNSDSDSISFKINTNLGSHEITIKIHEEQKPYVYSESTIKTDFKSNASFSFDTFGATFVSISGNEITNDDYSFLDGKITIKAEYIKEIFLKNLDRKNLILTYRFEKNGITYLGFLTIKK